MPPLKVIIVGGGLGGALLANGLVNNNMDVTVYERDSRETKREGYQIRLGSYALSAFRACLDPKLVALIEEKYGSSAVENGRSPYTAPSVYSTKLKPVIDLGKLPGYSVSTAINRVALRNFLVEPLKEKDKVRFNKAFSRYEIILDEAGSEKVRVHFDDGTFDTCDVVVGADGSSSKINRQIGVNNLVEIKSHWVFAAKGNLPSERIHKLPNRYLSGPTLTFHNGACLFYALYMPVKKEEGKAKNKLFNYDDTDASIYWSFYIPVKHSSYKDSSEIPDRLQFCLDYVKDWAPEYHTMLSVVKEDLDGADVAVVPFRASTEPSEHWREDAQRKGGKEAGHPRVWLLGDAIHAMQPNRGMGGNQAMYDCVEMLPELLKLNEISQSQQIISTEQIRQSLTRYESQMLPRAFKWVAKSGGTSPPDINFNGMLGLVLSIINSVFLPVIFAISKLF